MRPDLCIDCNRDYVDDFYTARGRVVFNHWRPTAVGLSKVNASGYGCYRQSVVIKCIDMYETGILPEISGSGSQLVMPF